MRPIDADETRKKMLNSLEELFENVEMTAKTIHQKTLIRTIIHHIDDAQTIEAAPIVRCKNCEFVDTIECPMNYIDHQRLIFSNRSPDWFCAEGVKKDET